MQSRFYPNYPSTGFYFSFRPPLFLSLFSYGARLIIVWQQAPGSRGEQSFDRNSSRLVIPSQFIASTANFSGFNLRGYLANTPRRRRRRRLQK